MPGPDKSKVKKDLTLGKKSKVKPDLTIDMKSRVNFRQHTHPLPLCSSGNHDASCAKSGAELSCVKVITGYNPVTNKLTYGAFCSHFIW